MRIKKVIFRNKYGEEITFTRHFPLYMEKINTFGVSGRFTSDSLIDSPGQFTSAFNVSGKTITAEFAFYDRYKDDRTLRKMERVFTPLETGLLTVFDTNNMIYRIEAYPTAAPSFQRIGKVLRWSMNFQADYPYWRKGYEMISYTFNSVESIIHNPSMVRTPIEIVFPADVNARTFHNITTGKYFRINSYTASDIIVNTKDFSVVNGSGQNINYILYTNDDVGNVNLMPGNNTIQIRGGSNSGDVVRFWELVSGVM